MSDCRILQRAAELAAEGTPLTVVTLAEATGSTPADDGAKMIVTAAGLLTGSVGGGRVEAKAIDLAQQMLSDGPRTRWVDWSLRADVGMTCGGRVRLLLETYNAQVWRVAVFGAGHVTQALTRVLAALPCRVTCIDPRAEWLAKLPAGVQAVQAAEPAELVDDLDPDTFVLCMTRGHTSDLPVLTRVYQRAAAFPYVGVIGSQAKARKLREELVAAGCDRGRLLFHCPVGLPIGGNEPGEIAVSIAAQLLEQRGSWLAATGRS